MTAMSARAQPAYFAPEVIQSSAMDCGPATLKCLLEGFGIRVSYGRLREACQTDVDGTSIDRIEEIATKLGLAAEQMVMPVDHLLLDGLEVLPALVVVRLATGLTHFVVAWRRHGPFVQIMDPAHGRRWISAKRLLNEIYRHELVVSAGFWREWATSSEFLTPVGKRLSLLGVSPEKAQEFISRSLADPSWCSLGALDATTRLIQTVVSAGGLQRGREASQALDYFLKPQVGDDHSPWESIPEAYWSVRQVSPSSHDESQLLVRGAVVLQVKGRKRQEESISSSLSNSDASRLSPELLAALNQPPTSPVRELFCSVRQDGWLAPAALTCAIALAAGSVVLEALVFRSLFDLSRDLTISGQRLGAMAMVLVFAASLLFLESPIARMTLCLGRRLETRFRLAFLRKIPRLVDRYFQSRLISDMAERAHLTQTLRTIPDLGARLLRASFELLFTVLGIIWLDPISAPFAVSAATATLVLPLLTNPLLTERDLRVRTHVGALARFHLDALLGLIPVRAHGAERPIRAEHESLLVEWARASLSLQRGAVATEGLQSLLSIAFAVFLVFAYLNRAAAPGGVLILIYWALTMPLLAQQIAQCAREYPPLRNVVLRLLEPLGAPEESPSTSATGNSMAPPETLTAAKNPISSGGAAAIAPRRGPVELCFRDVSVHASGHLILEGIRFSITPAEHVAIVGPSGAGKSTLVGLLLGWHRASMGQVLVDGQPLDSIQLEYLRQRTAWADPTVQLWNQSLLENLCYGLHTQPTTSLGSIVQQAELISLLRKLPQGMQTSLGESGGLVSGGEGQRVRLGRALLRPDAGLVILDEPFAGLDAEQRTKLLQRARQHWRNATLLCITHDVSQTLNFDRVIVIENGRLAEQGSPTALIQSLSSRYGAMLAADKEVREKLWSESRWRHQVLRDGRLTESANNDRRSC